jgi:hypothetical protein
MIRPVNWSNTQPTHGWEFHHFFSESQKPWASNELSLRSVEMCYIYPKMSMDYVAVHTAKDGKYEIWIINNWKKINFETLGKVSSAAILNSAAILIFSFFCILFYFFYFFPAQNLWEYAMKLSKSLQSHQMRLGFTKFW